MTGTNSFGYEDLVGINVKSIFLICASILSSSFVILNRYRPFELADFFGCPSVCKEMHSCEFDTTLS